MTKAQQITVLEIQLRAARVDISKLTDQVADLRTRLQDKRVPELTRLLEANAKLADSAARILSPGAF